MVFYFIDFNTVAGIHMMNMLCVMMGRGMLMLFDRLLNEFDFLHSNFDRLLRVFGCLLTECDTLLFAFDKLFGDFDEDLFGFDRLFVELMAKCVGS